MVIEHGSVDFFDDDWKIVLLVVGCVIFLCGIVAAVIAIMVCCFGMQLCFDCANRPRGHGGGGGLGLFSCCKGGGYGGGVYGGGGYGGYRGGGAYAGGYGGSPAPNYPAPMAYAPRPFQAPMGNYPA
ncbi:hypothetical protein BOX15_Mlig016206g1 [Macrostomum lignano]|uniref:Uncharacterized protein n=1 Tax=Macrostomum lignano TaxID=282301 RepID=A0A267DLI1_9PLAT|nr:hypothetical protein BOX15_Mlig032739g1 [Macrostomum lignano]PAA49808.1 hypothetical protein BOX15_Mlig016206g1 [Macrostomum lignano]